LGSVTLPESFTDRGLPSATRALTADVLTDLAAVISSLRTTLTVEKGDRNRVSE